MKILIFGSGPGLSRSVAHLFGQKGFAVSLVARNEDKLKQEIKNLEAANIKAEYFVADVGNEKSFAPILDKIRSAEDLPDVILYNAFSPSKSIDDETWDSLKKQLDVNVGGAFNLVKTALPAMQKRGKGKLFFTGGGFSIDPDPDYIGMGLGKAALRNVVQAAAKKAAGTNVHIATVTVCGYISGPDPKYAPDMIAEEFWKLYNQRQGEFQTELVY